MDIDFTNLALEQILGLLVLFAAVDTVGSVLIAIGAKTFNGEYITQYLLSHVEKVWFPIFALGLIGHGIGSLGIPAIPVAGLAATASLAAYAIATIASLKGSLDDKGAVP